MINPIGRQRCMSYNMWYSAAAAASAERGGGMRCITPESLQTFNQISKHHGDTDN